jgi:hypothetical protein
MGLTIVSPGQPAVSVAAERPWIPVLASLLASGFAAAIAVPQQPASELSTGWAIARAILVVCFSGCAGAATARFTFPAFCSVSDERALQAAVAFGGIGAWLGPLVVWIGQGHPGAVIGAGVMGCVSAELLHRFSDPEQDALPAAAGRDPLFSYQAQGASQTHLAAAIAVVVLLLEASAGAIVDGRAAVSAVFAFVACFALAALTAPDERFPRRLSRRWLRIELGLHGCCALAVAALGLVTFTSAATPGGRTASRTGAPSSRIKLADPNLLSGAILIVDPPRGVRLIAPVPAGRSVISHRRAKAPDVIDFSGVYWIHLGPMMRPPKSSKIVRESPENYNFTAVDRSPLKMQARQRLQHRISTRCCSAIEVAVRNADPQPRTIALKLTLILSAEEKIRRMGLGVQRVQAAGDVVLRFPMPTPPGINEFDEIVVNYDLAGIRMHRSANLSIQSFTLVPGGR